MSNSNQGANLQKIVGTATAVVGGIALMTKLGIDELQHRNMKYKTDPSNAYSSIRILPDLVQFQGYIRIHRYKGNIVCSVPRKIEQIKPQHNNDTQPITNAPDNQTETPMGDPNKANDNDDDVEDQIMSNNDHNHNKPNKEDNTEIKWLRGAPVDDPSKSKESKESGWFQSFSSFASNAKSKLQTMYESQTVEFDSDFPFVLRDSAIHKNQIEPYILDNNQFLDLFEPLSIDTFMDNQKSNKELPLNERWEFCPVKIHHETLYIRYAKKWITLSLNNINISPLTLSTSDCTAFIVDYQKYFTITEDKGYVLLCQHLDNEDGNIDIELPIDIEPMPIKIPNEHSLCPWPYVQRCLIGYHNTSYVSLRKEQVLKRIVEKVSNAMKDVGFDNHTMYNHCIQFRKCIDGVISQLDGAEKALLFKQNKKEKEEEDDDSLSDIDDDIAMSSKEENEMESKADNDNDDKEEKEEFLPYFNLLHDAYHGLNVHELSETEWKLTAEASWLSNYVYGIHVPQAQSPQNAMKRRDSWSHQFRSYMAFSASSHNLNDIIIDDDKNNDMDEGNIEYRGPPHLATDPLWKKHSDKHYENLSKFGFELLDYAVTQKGQSVQYMITRSYDHPNTIFLTFKGTSNPLDAMVNIGLHPLELPHFQCSVFSGMYSALQQSLGFICRKLNIYSSDEYFKHHECPPLKEEGNNMTKIYKLIINGHSLGGGLSQLFLAHLLSVNEFSDYFETVKCITFGAPLVFCKDVENSFFYKKLNDKCLNFVYQFDLVPRLQNGMSEGYRSNLLKGLLMSQLPVSNIGMVFDINQRLNYVLSKFQEHQWLLDRYCSVGKYIVLFEKDEPRSIDDKKQKCFTKSAKSYHISLSSNQVLTMTSRLKNDKIYAAQVLNDHKMLNYMKTIMFQHF